MKAHVRAILRYFAYKQQAALRLGAYLTKNLTDN